MSTCAIHSWYTQRHGRTSKERHDSSASPASTTPKANRSAAASVRQLSIDLIAVGDAELCLRQADAPSVINEYSLIPSQQPNVVVRVPPADLWLFDNGEAPWPVVVVDLLDLRDDRSVRAANDLARRVRAR